jgi:hypothetical protein
MLASDDFKGVDDSCRRGLKPLGTRYMKKTGAIIINLYFILSKAGNL